MGAVIALLLGGAGWALQAQAPVKVTASGIVLQQGGLTEIVADRAGRIERIALSPGDIVGAGEPVAEFLRSDLSRDLANTLSELEDARSRLGHLTRFYEEQDRRETRAEEERRVGIAETRDLLIKREAQLSEHIGRLAQLVRQKIVLQTRLMDAEFELTNARERLAQLNDEALKLGLQTIDRRKRQELALLEERLKVDSLQRQADRLQEELEEQRFVRTADSGRVVEIKVNRGDVVGAGNAIATLAPAEVSGEEAVGVLYVTPADGKRIEAGMAVEVVPSVYRREEYGHIKGEVIFVSSVPATAAGMRSVLRNEQLVTQFSKGAAPFEVRARFLPDPSTPSGLAWSASNGPDGEVNPGTLLDAAILVERLPIANLFVPGLAERLGVGRND